LTLASTLRASPWQRYPSWWKLLDKGLFDSKGFQDFETV
jgi:hypothetical protein